MEGSVFPHSVMQFIKVLLLISSMIFKIETQDSAEQGPAQTFEGAGARNQHLLTVQKMR